MHTELGSQRNEFTDAGTFALFLYLATDNIKCVVINI